MNHQPSSTVSEPAPAPVAHAAHMLEHKLAYWCAAAHQAGPVMGLLLAGGEGRRMGGRNKGLMRLNGYPLVWHVWQRLRPAIDALGGQMLLSANQQAAQYARWLGVVPMPDAAVWQGMGPLAALATLAEYGQRAGVPGHVLVQMAPCDTPHIPLDLTQRLLQRLCQLEAGGAVPEGLADAPSDTPLDTPRRCLAVYPEVPGQGVHPALALVRWAALEQVADYLRAGGRSVRGWLQQVGAQPVSFANAAAFANANTPQALQALQALQGQDPMC